jgi:SAM-dependent methyltransferase
VEKALSPAEFRAVWDAKPSLRAVYQDYYRRMAALLAPGGPTVEVGAGSGNLGQAFGRVLATDVVASPWLDAVVDAQALPFAPGRVANLVGVDVLHHVEYPRLFLAEALRVLRPGGRVVLVEPAVTPVSRVVFALGHPEPVDMSADPLAEGRPNGGRHPMDSNQALPTLLAARHRARLEAELPGLRVVHREHLSLLAYPLSGGFRPWNLLPARLVEPVLAIERRLAPALGRVAGFRLLLVLERSRSPPASAEP